MVHIIITIIYTKVLVIIMKIRFSAISQWAFYSENYPEIDLSHIKQPLGQDVSSLVEHDFETSDSAIKV